MIEPISWVAVNSVLPDEGRDFTPWLAQNLGLLGSSLGLSDLSLVEAEYSVLGFSLDILARAVGPDGQPVWVAIENQYRRTDHGHLGQLITYTAHAAKDQESVLAVWITEDAHPAHLAAVEFLNRTTNPASGVGYVLMQVRLAPAPENSYHIFLQVLARPNAFLQGGIQTGGPGGGSSNLEKRRAFMTRVYEIVRPAAIGAGANTTWMDPGGWQISLRFPPGTEMAAWPLELWVRLPDPSSVSVALTAFTGHSGDENRAVLTVVSEQVGEALAKALPQGTTIDWNGGYSGSATRYAISYWRQAGYGGGDVDAAGAWAATVSEAWLSCLLHHPIHDLQASVRAISSSVQEPGT